MIHILVVDDEPSIRETLGGILEDEGYRVTPAEDGESGLTLLRDQHFDVVLLDVWLPQMDGLAVLEEVKDLEDRPEVVMISGHGTVETAVRATKLGAYDFLEKPLSLDKTLIVVKNAAEARRLRSENQELKRQVSHAEIVGDSIPHEGAAAADRADGADQWTGADLRRERYGQGTGGARHPRPEPAQGRDVRGNQLRGDSRRPDRKRTVWLLQGRVSGSRKREGRQAAQGRRRNAFPGRSGRHEFEDAVQGAADAGRGTLCSGGNGGAGHGGCAGDRGDQQGSGRRDWARQLPRRSVLPAERGSVRGASAARAQGRYSGAGAAFSEGVLAASTAAAPRKLPTRRWRF